MTKFNIQAEALKIFNQFQEKAGHEVDQSYLPFLEYGIRHGILMAGMSLVNFEDESHLYGK